MAVTSECDINTMDKQCYYNDVRCSCSFDTLHDWNGKRILVVCNKLVSDGRNHQTKLRQSTIDNENQNQSKGSLRGMEKSNGRARFESRNKTEYLGCTGHQNAEIHLQRKAVKRVKGPPWMDGGAGWRTGCGSHTHRV